MTCDAGSEPPREIAYGTETIRYEVQRTPNRKTLGIEVHPDSRVLARAPLHCDEHLIAERMQKRARWISRKLAEFRRYHPRTGERRYLSGETHLHLGRQYRLTVVSGAEDSVKRTRTDLIVTLNGRKEPARVRSLIETWQRDQAKHLFSKLLDKTLPRFRSQHRPTLALRAMTSRWGSLSLKGTLTLNTNLIRAPRACIEYVITHELCHLRHRDHDHAFFRLLERVMPDWERRKDRLERSLL